MVDFSILYVFIIFLFYIYPLFKATKNKNFFLMTGLLFLFLYTNILIKYSIFPFFLNDGTLQPGKPIVNLILFASIHEILVNSSAETAVRQIIGNILLFMPLGFLLPIVSQKMRKPAPILITVFCVSLSIELVQFLISLITGVPSRVSDVDDILLNFIGGTLGYLCYLAANKLIFSKIGGETALGSSQK